MFTMFMMFLYYGTSFAMVLYVNVLECSSSLNYSLFKYKYHSNSLYIYIQYLLHTFEARTYVMEQNG